MKDSQAMIVGSAVVSGMTLLYLWWKYSKRKSSRWKEIAQVDRLYIHPIKSCRGIKVDSLTVKTKGLFWDDRSIIGDRSFLMTHENGRFATIRQYPKMVLITPTVTDKDQIQLTAPNMDPITVKAPEIGSSDARNYKIWGIPCPGVDCGGEVAEWLQKYLKANNARLVYHCQQLPSRKNNMLLEFGHLGVYAKEPIDTMFQDNCAFTLVSQASLDCLNTKLDEEHQINERYFRANALLNACDAFAEDSWKRIRIGSAEFRYTKLTHRCKVTTVNPETGVMDEDRNTLKSLSSFRLCKPEEKPIYGESPTMCVDFMVIRPGRINVGDKVYLHTGDQE